MCKIPSLSNRQSDVPRCCVRTYARAHSQLACRSRCATGTHVLMGSLQPDGSAGKESRSIRCFAHTMYSAPVSSRPPSLTRGVGGEACTVPSGAEYPQICYKMVSLRWLPCGPPMTCTALENSHWIVSRQTKARARKTMPYKIDVHSQGCKCDWNEQTSHLTYAAPKY